MARARYKRVVKCTNELCGSEFVDTGLGHEYLPNEFMVGHTYRAIQYIGPVKTILDFKIKKRRDGFIDAQVNGLFTMERILLLTYPSHLGKAEVLSFDMDLTGVAFGLMPYNLVNDKGQSE